MQTTLTMEARSLQRVAELCVSGAKRRDATLEDMHIAVQFATYAQQQLQSAAQAKAEPEEDNPDE
jgi:hypothetical protein